MNKKGILAVIALVLLAAALFLGLPFTTERIVNERVDQTFTVMATPTPSVDDYIQ